MWIVLAGDDEMVPIMAPVKHNYLTGLAVTILLVSSARGNITGRFDPSDLTVGLGDIFTMDIVADIPDSDAVLGWGLDLTIGDPSILSIVGDPAIGPLWNAAFAPDSDGLAALAFPNSISGTNVLLATMTFSADSLGETDLFLSVTRGDLTEGFPLDNIGFGTVVFEPGHVSVVPVPGAIALGLFGFGMLALLKRRSHNDQDVGRVI